MYQMVVASLMICVQYRTIIEPGVVATIPGTASPLWEMFGIIVTIELSPS